MKKLMMMMVVLGTVAFGRDNSFNAKRDVDSFVNVQQMSSQRKLPREIESFQDNSSRYNDFYHELNTMDRGHEGK